MPGAKMNHPGEPRRYSPFDGWSSASGEDLPMTTPQQPGWYDDPHDSNAQRYWDGHELDAAPSAKADFAAHARA
jgi:hypothetical protein